MRAWVLAGWLLGGAGFAGAQEPSVSQMLNLYHPRQPGVAVATPTPQEQEGCKVELVRGPKNSSATGWLLRDARGQPLRRYFDTNGDKKIDVWSYYQDGVEIYRERSTQFNAAVDEYRWLNAGGMKWGVSSKGDGKIDAWRMISAEEVSQEVFQAIQAKGFDRVKALWITDADLEALKLPAAEVSRLRELKAQAPAKFQSTVAKLNLGPSARWERFEATTPQCLPADQTGMERDLIKYPKATILYQSGDKHDWVQVGEMIQVGLAWRLVDAPAPGLPAESGGGEVAAADPALQPLLDELRKLDATAPKGLDGMGPNPAVAQYNLKRADLLQKISAKLGKGEERDAWVRQLSDCLSAAAQASGKGEKAASERLVALAQQTAKDQPGSPLAAYVTYREMSADYAAKLSDTGADIAKVQEQWLGRLAKFVQDYPKAEDTPDALLQLGMVSEVVGKETEAKKWYQQLATTFADKKPLADKASGALRRLDLEGKPLELAGTTTDGKPFDVKVLAGKVVVVYYWASWNQQYVGDFARLKALLAAHAGKVELVAVNLDSSAGGANPVAAGANGSLPGVQLAHPGGLDSPYGTHYGIMVLPNIFLVGKDGKVVSRTVQMSNLEEEVKKLVK
jgi:hypothetical protein